MNYTILLALIIAASACSKSSSGVEDPPDAAGDTGADVSSSDGSTDSADAASDGGGPAPGCNPIASEHDCLLPYPSDVFLVAGSVEVPDTAMPKTKDGEALRVVDNFPADGFGIFPSIVFTLGVPLDAESLVPQDRADDLSVTIEASTLLLDTSTGELVPHFSEVHLGGAEPSPAAAIRPYVRLKESTRYVVAVRGVTDVDGGDVPAPTVFAALRDDTAAAPAELRDRYASEIFAPLEELGVSISELDLAWDFTTRSREDAMGDMLSVRQNTLDWLANNTPTVTITEVNEGADLGVALVADTFRHVEGTFTAPLFMVEDAPGGQLGGSRGDRPVQGTLEVPFSLTIPISLEQDVALRPARFIQYGHGFFGTRREVVSEVQANFGNTFGMVMASVEWSGMTRDDRNWLTSALATTPHETFDFLPRIHQGMANQLVFTEVIKNVLPAEADVHLDGVAAYDPDQVYFLGISQGHILGGTFMALTPSIDRAVLHAGGAGIGTIMTRSYAFVVFETILGVWLESFELLKFVAMSPRGWERIDPMTYAPFVATDPLPGNTAKQILMQAGIGDTAVPNVATELHARAIGLPLVTPTPVSIPFLDVAPAPAPSGITIADFGIEDVARDWAPVTSDTETHEAVRRFDGVRQQMDQFLRPDGLVQDTCAGPCVGTLP
jgi:hypothetical protein